jgi:hypothetical protein
VRRTGPRKCGLIPSCSDCRAHGVDCAKEVLNCDDRRVRQTRGSLQAASLRRASSAVPPIRATAPARRRTATSTWLASSSSTLCATADLLRTSGSSLAGSERSMPDRLLDLYQLAMRRSQVDLRQHWTASTSLAADHRSAGGVAGHTPSTCQPTYLVSLTVSNKQPSNVSSSSNLSPMARSALTSCLRRPPPW